MTVPFNHASHWHVYKAELCGAIRDGDERGPQPQPRAPRAGLALYLLSHTYYMLITAIPKPRLQGVNLVGHYASLYFRVPCVGPLWGFGRGVEVRMRSWRKWVKGALCLTREKRTEEGRVASLLAELFVWLEWKSWHRHFRSNSRGQREDCGLNQAKL